MNKLDEIRMRLDSCDDEIIELLTRRMGIIEEIIQYKKESGTPILQPKQEQKQEKALEQKLDGQKYEEEIKDIFRYIVSNSKRIQAKNLFHHNILLIGFMGCGKSTVSSFLCKMLAMDSVEMDAVIVEREGMSINDIFTQYGEEYFRNLETNLLIELSRKNQLVVSCGGGAALRDVNVQHMKTNGRVVLLTAKPETILERVKDNDDRPLLRGNKNVEFIGDLMEKRRAKYEAAADIVISTDDKSVLEICQEMIRKLMELDT
ncbi:MAG: shikimate kinase [Lachnospiraceae bacterium]|nr:shikimate kinase [Lachnospiraceae bacterium]